MRAKLSFRFFPFYLSFFHNFILFCDLLFLRVVCVILGPHEKDEEILVLRRDS